MSSSRQEHSNCLANWFKWFIWYSRYHNYSRQCTENTSSWPVLPWREASNQVWSEHNPCIAAGTLQGFTCFRKREKKKKKEIWNSSKRYEDPERLGLNRDVIGYESRRVNLSVTVPGVQEHALFFSWISSRRPASHAWNLNIQLLWIRVGTVPFFFK